VPGDNRRLWEWVRNIGAAVDRLTNRVDAINRLVTSIAGMIPAADMMTREGHARLVGTLTRGSIGSPQSCDANPYRKTETGWEINSDVTIKIWDNGFLPLATLTDVDIRWKAFGRDCYYDGGGCPT